MSFQFFTKSPKSMQLKNFCQSPRRTRRKIHQGPRRDVTSTTFVQILIRRRFTDSEIRSDDTVRFIKSINALEKVLSCRLIKLSWAVGSAFEPQRPGMPSKNCSNSLSSVKESNVHI